MLVRSTLLALALTASPAVAQGPPALPGPPPGGGTDLPSSPGTAPPFVPPGTAAAIPDTSGPGLVGTGRVALDRVTPHLLRPARLPGQRQCARARRTGRGP